MQLTREAEREEGDRGDPSQKGSKVTDIEYKAEGGREPPQVRRDSE